MKKAMSIAIAALMVTGMTVAIAGECGGCPSKDAEKKAECSAEKTVACSSACPSGKTDTTEETKQA